MTENWTQWQPIEGLASKYYVEFLCDTPEGLTILLFDENNQKIRLTFKSPLTAYRFTDESFRLMTMDYLSKKYGAIFYGYWTFFKVTNSSYIEWLSKEMDGNKINEKVQHFSLITTDSFIDILYIDEPEVQVIS